MTIDTSIFHVTANDKAMSADASDVTGAFKVKVEGVKLITIKSHKTGAVTDWVLFNVVSDNDGDIVCWQYKPTAKSIGTNPKLYDWILEIFND